jgi:hypothetical protein
MTETTITTARTGARADAAPDAADPGDGRDGVGADGRRHPGGIDPLFGVRTADIEPYTGLRYLSKLFRMIAVVLVLLLIAEVVTGLYAQGAEALSTLLAEVSRLIVLAGLLWGAGDLAILLIDVGHDVRAARILLGRQTGGPQHGLPATPATASHGTAARGERLVERGGVGRDGLA